MALVAVKNKYQVVIPQSVRERIGINVGDLMEAGIQHPDAMQLVFAECLGIVPHPK